LAERRESHDEAAQCESLDFTGRCQNSSDRRFLVSIRRIIVRDFFKSVTADFRRADRKLPAVAPSSMLRRTFLPCLIVAATWAMLGQSAEAFFGNDIIYSGTQPAGKPAFGQRIMVSGQIVRTDRGPLANQTVQLWFSGRHGIQDTIYTVKTDRFGKFNALMTIPRSWSNLDTWVDVTFSCTSIGATKLFRVRNK
jgi:hypothetical protein